MKLELKHLAPYLPYGLKVLISNGDAKPYEKELTAIFTLKGELIQNENDKPILRPLSDLTKAIEYDGDTDKGINFISTSKQDAESTAILLKQTLFVRLPYWKILRLLEMHFDVFGLIEKGLAVDINTLDQ